MIENHDRSRDVLKANRLRRPARLVIAGVLVVFVLLSAGYLPRKKNAEAEETAALDRDKSLPDVATWTVQAGSSPLPLLLPGNIEPIEEAVLYARIDGYVNQQLVDILDRVQKAQLVAIVSSPETE